MNVLGLLQDQTLVLVAQLLIGKYLKQTEWFQNKFIPIATYVVALLGFTLTPTAAHAGVLTPLAPALNFGLLALLQTVTVTGIHGISKNTVLPILKEVLRTAAFAVLKDNKPNG